MKDAFATLNGSLGLFPPPSQYTPPESHQKLEPKSERVSGIRGSRAGSMTKYFSKSLFGPRIPMDPCVAFTALACRQFQRTVHAPHTLPFSSRLQQLQRTFSIGIIKAQQLTLVGFMLGIHLDYFLVHLVSAKVCSSIMSTNCLAWGTQIESDLLPSHVHLT